MSTDANSNPRKPAPAHRPAAKIDYTINPDTKQHFLKDEGPMTISEYLARTGSHVKNKKRD